MRVLWMASFCLSASAAVTAVYVGDRTDVLQSGRIPYERITGRVHFAVDPGSAANRLIRDVQLAKRNEAKMVEFSADFYVLKPRDPSQGNGTLLFEVSNRGGKGMVMHFDLARGSKTPGTAAGDLGDAYLLEQGYTLAWVGWQADVPRDPDNLRLYSPTVPVRGRVRSDFVLDKSAPTATLADMGHHAYPAIDDGTAQLTVRDSIEAARNPIPRDRWRFVENGTAVALDGGFEQARIYEVIYTSENPFVVGLGPAAVRDFISFLKYGGPETLLSDQSQYIKRTLGYGISQSGRFLRDFVYEGFNADEKGRRVFDGVWAHVAGAGRGNFNYRFAQPSRDARPFLNFFYPVDIFPFSDLPQRDPATGATAGLLDRARHANVVPKIFYINGSYEYWGRAASLIHTTPDGSADAPVAPDTRIYFIAGTQHGPGAWPPGDTGSKYKTNPNDYRYVLRALLADFQAWLKDGTAPPESRYPKIADGQLAAPAQVRFPGATPPTTYHKAYAVDYGPEFASAGIVNEPPKVGAAYRVLVPQVDADGNEMGGIRLPEIAVPLAAYTGWNYRAAAAGAPNEMASFLGSYFAFQAAVVIARYGTESGYEAKVRAAAEALAAERLVLPRDVPALLERAHRQWAATDSAGSR